MSSSTNPAPVDEEEFPIPEIGPDNRVLCPKCKTYINLGAVGIANLTERHWKSAKCDKNRRKHKEMEVVEKTKAAAKTFFMLRPPKVPISSFTAELSYFYWSLLRAASACS